MGLREEAGGGHGRPKSSRCEAHGGFCAASWRLRHTYAESGGRAGAAAPLWSPLLASLSPMVRRSTTTSRSREVGRGHDVDSFRAEQERRREKAADEEAAHVS